MILSLFFQLTLITHAAPPPAPAPPAQPINQVLASVGSRTITSREVRIQSVLESIVEGSSTGILDFSIRPQEPRFQKELTKAILEWMIYLEAQAVGMSQVGTPEIESTQKVALSKMSESEQKLWARLGVSEKELTSYVERKLRAKRFLEYKSKSTAVTATDVEAQRYFEQHRKRFGDQPFEKFKDNIKALLSTAESEERLKEWFSILKRKYRVRYVNINT